MFLWVEMMLSGVGGALDGLLGEACGRKLGEGMADEGRVHAVVAVELLLEGEDD